MADIQSRNFRTLKQECQAVGTMESDNTNNSIASGGLTVTYTPDRNSPTQTLTVRGQHIFNQNGAEVFPAGDRNTATDRLKVYANLAVKQRRAVVVSYRNHKYVVNEKGAIIDENGNRVLNDTVSRDQIIALAVPKLASIRQRNKESQSITAREDIARQLKDFFTEMGIMYTDEEAEFILRAKENGMTASQIKEALEKGELQMMVEEFSPEMMEIRRQLIKEGLMSEDGTKRLAPNGKQSNLNERQYLQVRTRTFKEWFGDWEKDPRHASKIVDENGEPMVMIHGSQAEFKTFRRKDNPNGSSGRGMYFGRAPKDLSNYSYGTGHNYLCFLNIRNLFEGMYIREKDSSGKTIPGEIMNNIIGTVSYEEFVSDLTNFPKKFATYDYQIAAYKRIDKKTWQRIHNKYDGKGSFSAIKHKVSHWFRADETYLTLDHEHIGEIVVRDPNQIKSATANIGTFSRENDEIYMMQESNNQSNETFINKLKEYESRLRRNAEALGVRRQTADSGLLDDARSRIQRRGSNENQVNGARTESQESVSRRNREDEAALEKLAKEQGQWLDNADEELEKQYGKRIGHGAESYVYLKDANTVVKSRTIDPNVEGGYKTYQEALESIAIHNRLFPETAMKIVGFGRSDGEFCVIIEQPHIADGRFATPDEIRQFIADRFGEDTVKDENVAGGHSYKNPVHLLQDLKPKNVIIKKVNGKDTLFVIDGDFYNTQEYQNYLDAQQSSQATDAAGIRNGEIQLMAEDNTAQKNLSPTSGQQIAWINENREQLVEKYLEKNGNRWDPDAIRDMLEPIGYNRENLPDYLAAGGHLAEIILQEMSSRFARSDNKTITILTGTPGSGKSTATQSRKAEFDKKGLVLDAPFHSIGQLQQAINHAREAGVRDEDIQVVAVYNDIVTTYKNTIRRGKDSRRWVPLKYFLESFVKNQGKIKALIDNNPNISIVTIDNSNNQGREVSHDEAVNWDYTVSYEQIYDLLNLIYNDNGITEQRKQQLTKETFNEGVSNENAQRLAEVSGKEQGLESGRTGRALRKNLRTSLRSQLGLDTDETGEFQNMMSSDGRTKYYGFAFRDKFWADLSEVNPEAYLHENTHLWDKVIAKQNPRLWKRGIQLMKSAKLKAEGSDISIWQWVEQNPCYGMSKGWQKLKNSKNSKDRAHYEFLVASEVHARLVGREGQEILAQLAETRGAKGIVAKFKQWLADFYKALVKHLPSSFRQWTDSELNALTWEDFRNMTLRDIMEGAHRADFSQTQTAAQMSQETRSETYTPEMIAIKQEAEDNGTFMKAPNGRPSNLNERQYLQVRTKAFKNWFGDWENDPANASKVVDKNGEPLVVYHNTDNNFTKFSKFRSLIGKLTGSALFGRGFYFSNYQGSSRRINMPVFLSVKNPAEGVMESGNDGMIHDFGNGQVWYAAKKPNQIKSATDNIGTFSRENDDIQMMMGKNQKNNSNFVNENKNSLNDFINGKTKFNNLTEEENDVARRDRILAEAGIQARRNGKAGQEESQDERNERQEEQVTQWAKQEGIWHEDAIAFGQSFGEELPRGNESHVYENTKNGTVVKVKNTLQYHDLLEFLDGIILHNTLFPETAYKVLGFGNDGEGFVVVLEQPFVRGIEPTQQQIDDFIKEIQPDAEKYEEELKNGRYRTPQTLIHDISPRNAVLTPGSNIAVIDGIIRPNVPSEGKGGQRSEDYSIIPSTAENYEYNATDFEDDDFQLMAEDNSETQEEAQERIRREEDYGGVPFEDEYDEYLKSLEGEDDFQFMAEDNSQPAPKPTTPKGETVKRLLTWNRWQKQHIVVDKKAHVYYIDGVPANYSVTQYMEKVYGKPDIHGDYAFAQEMGNAVDALTRDFFNHIFNKGSDPAEKAYKNLSEKRKNEIIEHLKRLKEQFDKEFVGKDGKPDYRVITSEIPLAATIIDDGEVKKIAGTPDMLIVDSEGNIHILDMKVKSNSIDDWNNRRDYTFQLNAYRQIIEATFPELKGKIKDLRLIWFNTAYPKQGKGAWYSTDEQGIVTVTDNNVRNTSLAGYYAWQTPSLRANVSESLLPLMVEDHLKGTQPIVDLNNTAPLQPSTGSVIDVKKISTKTADYGVVIAKNLKDNWEAWKRKNPYGIIAYRVHWNRFNSPEEARNGIIGNPFTTSDYGEEKAGQLFADWLITGNNFGNIKATEEYRQAIIDKIMRSPEDAPTLYYKELNRPSHATVIGYLIRNKHLLKDAVSPSNISSDDFVMHSGGAVGSDSMWEEIGKLFGIRSFKHYYLNDPTRQKPARANTLMSEKDREEAVRMATQAAARNYGFNYTISDPLVLRDWAPFAVCHRLIIIFLFTFVHKGNIENQCNKLIILYACKITNPQMIKRRKKANNEPINIFLRTFFT